MAYDGETIARDEIMRGTEEDEKEEEVGGLDWLMGDGLCEPRQDSTEGVLRVGD